MRALSCQLLAFYCLTALFAATPSFQAYTGKKLIPWLDYDGLAAASQQAINDARTRSGQSIVTPVTDTVPTCASVRKRVEWRELSTEDKKSYMIATKCLLTTSGYNIASGQNNFWDAMVQVHQTKFQEFHGNAAFLLWHRWYTWLRSEAITKACNYTGPTPYWNYTADWQDPHASPIFSSDPETGFGSHGSVVVNELGASSYKVDNGAFANLKLNNPAPHFLARNFSATLAYDPTGKWGKGFGNFFNPDAVKAVMAKKTFWDISTEINGQQSNNPSGATLQLGIHNAPHYSSGGDWNGPLWIISTRYGGIASTAPNDPMFFPHHAYMDAVFWGWQNLPGNQWLYSGSRDANNLRLNNAVATDLLPFHDLGPDISIALALKTESWPQCYTY